MGVDVKNWNSDAFSRRDVLAMAATASAASLAPPALRQAMAKAPLQNMLAPAWYRFKIGSFEATVVSDGPIVLGPPQSDLLKGVSKEEFARVLADNFLRSDNVLLEQNVLVVNTGSELVLFDTGSGSAKMFGDKVGRLIPTLQGAGFDPKDFDAVILTHTHPDHCWGLLGATGAPAFPNARIYLTRADLDFWTDESKGSDDFMKAMIAGTRAQLLPLRERLTFIRDGQEIVSGIQAIAAPGHTVGHTVFMISSSGQSLLNAGDLAHHQVLSTERPQLEFAFDTDGKQAVASRMRIFDMLAAQRIPMLGYHFAWPGIGYLARQGAAFRYFPAPMQTAP
ncbi:MAG: MBL fold metallo-hydrolase [Pseudorhodoplanes sp.]|nr:MBL fold metallo-hydrolase [Pseudorhodoplanes sp.]